MSSQIPPKSEPNRRHERRQFHRLSNRLARNATLLTSSASAPPTTVPTTSPSQMALQRAPRNPQSTDTAAFPLTLYTVPARDATFGEIASSIPPMTKADPTGLSIVLTLVYRNEPVNYPHMVALSDCTNIIELVSVVKKEFIVTIKALEHIHGNNMVRLHGFKLYHERLTSFLFPHDGEKYARWFVETCARSKLGDSVKIEALFRENRLLYEPFTVEEDAKPINSRLIVTRKEMDELHKETKELKDDVSFMEEENWNLMRRLARYEVVEETVGFRQRRRVPPLPLKQQVQTLNVQGIQQSKSNNTIDDDDEEESEEESDAGDRDPEYVPGRRI